MPNNTSQYEIEKDSPSLKIHPELVWYSPSDLPFRTKNQRKKREANNKRIVYMSQRVCTALVVVREIP